jgi:hypothetical protein
MTENTANDKGSNFKPRTFRQVFFGNMKTVGIILVPFILLGAVLTFGQAELFWIGCLPGSVILWLTFSAVFSLVLRESSRKFTYSELGTNQILLRKKLVDEKLVINSNHFRIVYSKDGEFHFQFRMSPKLRVRLFIDRVEVAGPQQFVNGMYDFIQENRRESLTLQEFAKMPSGHYTNFIESAVQGPADCRIRINKYLTLYDDLTQVLRANGLSTAQTIDLVNTSLIGVCPECNTWTAGQGLTLLTIARNLGQNAVFTGNTGGMERLLKGVCRNSNCSCPELLIFWRPDEDRRVITLLAQKGIEIIPSV